MRKSQVKKSVYKILEEDARAREDDNYLIYRTVKILLPGISETFFKTTLLNLSKAGISFESITRFRRKFLEEHPEFKPKQFTRIREEEKRTYKREYSKHIPRID